MTLQPAVIATALAAAIVIALSGDYDLQAQGTPQGEVKVKVRKLTPGDVLDAKDVDFIERPGFYGLGSDLRGSRYAIIDGYLVRVDPDSLQVQSVLRSNVRSID
ncbi:hypothetical protein [Paracoccus sp. SSK6]|uniref:hypothetical protein n=1 Tax=Paracoccus sp. SSK6 TaxID=3143131 RepID=UPI00321C2DD9